MDSDSATVSALVPDLMDELTEAEHRVGREFLADYPACLGSSQSLAKGAGVCAPTVVRFSTSLGFSGFTSLRQHPLRDLAGGEQRRPSHLRERHRPSTPPNRGEGDAPSDRCHGGDLAAHPPFRDRRRDAFDRIRRCACARDGQLLLGVGRTENGVQLSQVRSEVVFVAEPLRREAGLLLDARKRSVFIVLDMRATSLLPARWETRRRRPASTSF